MTARKPSAIVMTIVTAPSHGVLTGTGPSWTYTPNPDFNGDDTIVVRADDDFGSASATVSIQISAVNDAPAAEPDSFAAGFETPLTISHTTLLANDADIDSVALTVTGVTAGTHGTATIDGGNVVFVPEVGFEGVATFAYTVSDADLGTEGMVTVTIGADVAPVAVADIATTTEDTALQLADSVLVANDTDVEQQTLAISAVGSATHGTVSHAGNQVTFTPDANYAGAASFDYTVSDGYKTSVATVAVTVTPVNDAPAVVGDSASTDEDMPVGVSTTTLLANDTDIENDTLAVASVTDTSDTHGSASLANGVVTYTPAPNYNGTATFTYTASDGNGGTTEGTVTITVGAVDDMPVAVDDATTVGEDAAATAITVLANDTDVDVDPMTIASVTQPAHGTVVITNSGADLAYAPNANYCNKTAPLLKAVIGVLGEVGFAPLPPPIDTFTYTLAPGGDTATVSVTVTCSDDAPTAVADTATVAEGSTANALTVLANDTDIDGGPLTIASVTQPANGSVAIVGNGSSLEYTPAAAYCNEAPNTALDTFTYTLAPGGSSSTVSLTVTCACGQNKTTDFVVGSN